jgi:hypothetical protein
MSRRHHSAWQEGMDAGIIGGLVVAVWFLALDLVAGRPFMTPSVLGQIVLFGEAEPQLTPPVFGAILLYTVVHFVLFALLGMVVARLVHLSVSSAFWRYGLLAIFVVFEFSFYSLMFLLFAATREIFPFWSVLIANTLAAIAMATYFWRTHPSLRRSLEEVPLGAAPRR